jgi:hypothetical protein
MTFNGAHSAAVSKRATRQVGRCVQYVTMVVAGTVGILIITFASLGVYELLSARADRSVPLATRRRNAVFLILASVGALGLCAATASFFSWSARNNVDVNQSWEAGEARLQLEQRIASVGILTSAVSSIIALAIPRRATPWGLKIAAMLPLLLAVVWVALVGFVVTGLRIQ